MQIKDVKNWLKNYLLEVIIALFNILFWVFLNVYNKILLKKIEITSFAEVLVNDFNRIAFYFLISLIFCLIYSIFIGKSILNIKKSKFEVDLKQILLIVYSVIMIIINICMINNPILQLMCLGISSLFVLLKSN